MIYDYQGLSMINQLYLYKIKEKSLIYVMNNLYIKCQYLSNNVIKD
jgi:hypothetical protein